MAATVVNTTKGLTCSLVSFDKVEIRLDTIVKLGDTRS